MHLKVAEVAKHCFKRNLHTPKCRCCFSCLYVMGKGSLIHSNTYTHPYSESHLCTRSFALSREGAIAIGQSWWLKTIYQNTQTDWVLQTFQPSKVSGFDSRSNMESNWLNLSSMTNSFSCQMEHFFPEEPMNSVHHKQLPCSFLSLALNSHTEVILFESGQCLH